MGKITDIELALGQQEKLTEKSSSDKKPTHTLAAIHPEVVLCSDDGVSLTLDTPVPEKETSDFSVAAEKPYVRQIVWFNVIKLGALHVFAMTTPFLVPFAANATICFMFFLSFLTLLGVQVTKTA